ncbi:acid protease [Cucurbitaria berberidis CBS 394.84]|uniref:Acid protease n=1 Tax=Cucurbitaria berberidis CBS 394.84 TaxID=1168544 RepID=A0A9P4LEB5_9PLEO|nr:acid protease [Cucurbitaria berberidis CBS 394.84]KAF1851708.1 acid protease [Cucurbitaria berberidis CBS 394.84]
MGLAARATAAPEPYVVPPSKQFDGNDGSWSTFKISVGTPGQDFRVLPSTKGGVTYLVTPDGCIAGVDPANCPNLRGAEVFKSTQNSGYQVNASSSWSSIGLYDVDLEDALNYTAGGLFGFDKVSLGPAADTASLSLDRQVVAGVPDPAYFMGILPLGQAESSFSSLSQPIDSLLYQLRNATKIPSLSYAYTAGAKYRLKSVLGSLILGGYDQTRFKADNSGFSFTFSTDSSKLLTVGVESIMATNTLQGTVSMTSGAHFSVIDSTVPHLWLPKDACAQFETAFGLTYDSQTDLYRVNDTIHRELLSKNPMITIKLVNSLQDTSTKYTNIQLPYAAFDLQASYPFYTNATNYFPIRRAANDSQYVLGRTLLQEAYLIVDYERANFTVAQAVFPDPLPAAKVITITSSNSKSNNSKSSGIGTGAIVGIAVGAAVLLILGIIAFLFYRRRRTQKKQPYELAGNQVLESGSRQNLAAGGVPLKSPAPQELSGTPLTELDSPHVEQHNAYPQDVKLPVSINDTPQELHAESMTPVTPRWQEVTLPLPLRTQHEMDGASSGSRTVSHVPSDDGYATGELGPRSGVSPLTPQFHQHH